MYKEENGVLTYKFQIFTDTGIGNFADGIADNAIDVAVRLSWTDAAGNTYTEDIHFESEFAGEILSAGQGLQLTVTNYEQFQNLTFQVMVTSGSQMVIYTAPMAYPSGASNN